MAGKRESNKRQTRKSIMEAAVRLFGEKGFDHTSIEELAQAAGIGKGTIYTYFRTKNDILYAFCEDGLELIRQELEPDRDLTLLEKLLTLFQSEFRYFSRNRDFGRLYMQEAVFPRPADLDAHLALDNRYFDLMFPMFQQAMDRGELRRDLEPLHIAGHFYGLYIMTVSAWYSGYLNSESEIFKAMQTLFRQALDGLAPSLVNNTTLKTIAMGEIR
ncbi:MAG: TetR/AcrR family transcriptional regulator [Pseudomonadota bacterium]